MNTAVLASEEEGTVVARRVSFSTGAPPQVPSPQPTESDVPAPEADPSDDPLTFLGKSFVFAAVWAVGGLLGPEDRLRFNSWLIDKLVSVGHETLLPPGGEEGRPSLFSRSLDPFSLEWEPFAVYAPFIPQQVCVCVCVSVRVCVRACACMLTCCSSCGCPHLFRVYNRSVTQRVYDSSFHFAKHDFALYTAEWSHQYRHGHLTCP